MDVSSIWGNCFDTSSGSPVATLACVPYLVKNIVDVAIALAGTVAVFLIVWGGIQYIRSGGDPKQAEGAKHTITYAIIGLIVVLMAYFIISVVSQLTGADCITKLGFTNCQTTSPTGKPFCPVNKPFSDPDYPYPTDGCDCSSDSFNNGEMCRQSCAVDVVGYGGFPTGECGCPPGTTDDGTMCKTQ